MNRRGRNRLIIVSVIAEYCAEVTNLEFVQLY
jgi:hypothetical protein